MNERRLAIHPKMIFFPDLKVDTEGWLKVGGPPNSSQTGRVWSTVRSA